VYVNDQGPVPVKSTPRLLDTLNPQSELLLVKTAVGKEFTVNNALVLFVVPHEFVA
jgi:hypothetical protein